jgi:hypothetical protein
MHKTFPGMNPFLEDLTLWPAFHHELVSVLHSSINSPPPSRYLCTTKRREYTVPNPIGQSKDEKRQQEDYIEIREREQGGLITLIDVVDPQNKTTESGRQAILETWRAARGEGASIVEIDLVLQGRPLFDFSREGLPDWDYSVTVVRSTHPDRYELYTSTLYKRLPRFSLPLAKDERNMVVDLGAMFARAFAGGSFAERIDFDYEAPADVISRYAYRIWQRDGHPHGRDEDHWYRAIAYVRGEAAGAIPGS